MDLHIIDMCSSLKMIHQTPIRKTISQSLKWFHRWSRIDLEYKDTRLFWAHTSLVLLDRFSRKRTYVFSNLSWNPIHFSIEFAIRRVICANYSWTINYVSVGTAWLRPHRYIQYMSQCGRLGHSPDSNHLFSSSFSLFIFPPSAFPESAVLASGVTSGFKLYCSYLCKYNQCPIGFSLTLPPVASPSPALTSNCSRGIN